MGRVRERFFSRWDRVVLVTACICAAALIAAQVLMLRETPRYYLSRVDRLEGETVSFQSPLPAAVPPVITDNAPVANRFTPLRQRRAIVLRMLQPQPRSDVYATINGVRAGDFGKGELRLAVYEGDYIEIDATRLDTAGRFIVNTADNGPAAPENGLVLEGKNAMLAVGKVRYKR